MSDDTRDLLIEARTDLRNLIKDFREFAEQAEKHRTCVQTKFREYDALMNKGKGAWWGITAIAAGAGVIGGKVGAIVSTLFGK